MRSTHEKPTQLEVSDTTTLRGRKMCDMNTKVYDVRNSIFSDQTGQFQQQSRRGNKYIMVVVEINSKAIIVEPINSRNDAELTRAYCVLILSL